MTFQTFKNLSTKKEKDLNKNNCKYILHSKENTIDMVRIEDDSNSEVLDYVYQSFGSTCSVKASTQSQLMVFSNVKYPLADRNNLFFSVIPDMLSFCENEILCYCPDKRIKQANSLDEIDNVSFKAFTIDELTKIFNQSLFPFHRIDTIDWFSKQYGLKKIRTVGV